MVPAGALHLDNFLMDLKKGANAVKPPQSLLNLLTNKRSHLHTHWALAAQLKLHQT